MELNQKQKQALENAFNGEELTVVINFLTSRESEYNPWFDVEGGWYNQTDNKGYPIEGEARNRLLYHATNPSAKVTSTLRLTPYDRIKLATDRCFDDETVELTDVQRAAEYLMQRIIDYRTKIMELLEKWYEIEKREALTEVM